MLIYQELLHLMDMPHMPVQAVGRELKPETWIFRFAATVNLLPTDVALGPPSARPSSLPSFNVTLFPGMHLVLVFSFCTIDQI